MLAWWEGLSMLQRIYVFIATPATIALIVQTVLVLLGGADVDVDLDFDVDVDAAGAGDGFSLFSIRGLMAFFCVGGWTGVVLLDFGVFTSLSIIISILVGFAALYAVALLFRWANRLQDKGNVSLQNAVGKTATVYIRVPTGGKSGKVNMTLQGRYTEITAVTRADRDLTSGERVVVLGLADPNTLLVAPFDDAASEHTPSAEADK